jgi:cell division protein FtsB
VILTLSTINEDEIKLQRNKIRVLAILDSALKSLDDYLNTYEIYADFIRLDHAKSNEQLNHHQPTLDQCRQEIKKHNAEIEKLYRDVPK